MSNIFEWFRGFRFKMLLLILIPGFFLCLLMILSLYVNREVGSAAAQVTEVRVPSIQGLEMMDEGRNNIRFIFYDIFSGILRAEGSEIRNKINVGLERYKEGWNLYAPLEQTPDEAQEWNKYEPLSKVWESRVNEITGLLMASNIEAAKMLFEKEYKKATDEASVPFQRILKINYEVVAKEKLKFDQTNKRSTFFSLIFGLSGIFGALLIGLYIAQRLSNELALVTDSIANSSGQVFQASQSLSQAAVSLSTAAQEQASTIEETSTSISTLVSVVRGSAEMSDSTTSIAREMEQLSQETTHYMENLFQAMTEILESNHRIEKLVKIIEEIGVKTEIIDDIVFKTQLLSFNASVEAERAGEHGRGFAVVAQEVGNLAQMSGQAASEISIIVKNSIKEAGGVAQENKDRVQKGSALANETKEKTQKVSSLIQEVLKSSNLLSISNKEQSQNINEIDLAVENLSMSTQLTARNAEESSSSSLELSSQSNLLKGLVAKLEQILYGRSRLETNQIVDVKSDHERLDKFKSLDSWKKAS